MISTPRKNRIKNNIKLFMLLNLLYNLTISMGQQNYIEFHYYCYCLWKEGKKTRCKQVGCIHNNDKNNRFFFTCNMLCEIHASASRIHIWFFVTKDLLIVFKRAAVRERSNDIAMEVTPFLVYDVCASSHMCIILIHTIFFFFFIFNHAITIFGL